MVVTAPDNVCLILEAALTLPALVLPRRALSIPVWPFDVASTAGSTVAVFCVLVCAVVGNVVDGAPPVSVNASSVRNTSA